MSVKIVIQKIRTDNSRKDQKIKVSFFMFGLCSYLFFHTKAGIAHNLF